MAFEAKCDFSAVELMTPKDNLGKTVALCAEAISRAERAEAYNARLEVSIALKDAELKRQAEELEELRAFKLSALGRIKELEGQAETLAVEVA